MLRIAMVANQKFLMRYRKYITVNPFNNILFVSGFNQNGVFANYLFFSFTAEIHYRFLFLSQNETLVTGKKVFFFCVGCISE